MAEKNMVNVLDYEGTGFPVSTKSFSKIEKKNNICINVFCYENGLVYLIHISDEKFKNGTEILMIAYENKSHYVYIKDLTDIGVIRQSVKIKNTFASIVYNVLVVKKFWENIKRFV